jgi:hypothetical protein
VPTPHEIVGCVITHPEGVGPFVGGLVGLPVGVGVGDVVGVFVKLLTDRGTLTNCAPADVTVTSVPPFACFSSGIETTELAKASALATLFSGWINCKMPSFTLAIAGTSAAGMFTTSVRTMSTLRRLRAGEAAALVKEHVMYFSGMSNSVAKICTALPHALAASAFVSSLVRENLALIVICKGASVGLSVGLSVGDFVGDVVGLSVGAVVGDSVGAVVGDSVGDEVGDSVGDLVGDSVGDDVGDSVGDDVGDSVESVTDPTRPTEGKQAKRMKTVTMEITL